MCTNYKTKIIDRFSIGILADDEAVIVVFELKPFLPSIGVEKIESLDHQIISSKGTVLHSHAHVHHPLILLETSIAFEIENKLDIPQR